MEPTNPRPPLSRWIAVVAAVVFLAYALNFLYFFVDDEGIPLVYAQNLLHGRGLIYAAHEGHVEGYSDFLHVVLDSVLLGIVRLLHAPKVVVFAAGKAFSLAS